MMKDKGGEWMMKELIFFTHSPTHPLFHSRFPVPQTATRTADSKSPAAPANPGACRIRGFPPCDVESRCAMIKLSLACTKLFVDISKRLRYICLLMIWLPCFRKKLSLTIEEW
jgi:hypothetical protein